MKNFSALFLRSEKGTSRTSVLLCTKTVRPTCRRNDKWSTRRSRVGRSGRTPFCCPLSLLGKGVPFSEGKSARKKRAAFRPRFVTRQNNKHLQKNQSDLISSMQYVDYPLVLSSIRANGLLRPKPPSLPFKISHFSTRALCNKCRCRKIIWL